MTNDELQKMLEFVAQRQEVFADNMDKAEKRMNQLERGFVALFNVVNDTAKLQKELAESQKELQAQQAHTDERLNALINVVEKIITEGRNGRAS
jgi:small-conductance mechanosensitive channel